MISTQPDKDAGAEQREDVSSAQPDTVVALLRQLGLIRVSAHKQRQALAGWLAEHHPGRALRLSLYSNGFGQLLEPPLQRPPVMGHNYVQRRRP